jgi:hypothetical protein
MKSSDANALDACQNPTNNALIAECNAARGEARDLQTLTAVALIAGGVVLTTGVVIFLTAPSKRGAPRTGAAWTLVPQPLGAAVIGRF